MRSQIDFRYNGGHNFATSPTFFISIAKWRTQRSILLGFQYTEPLSQLRWPYASVHQKLRMTREKISKLKTELVFPSQHMNSAHFIFENSFMSLKLLYHCFVCLSQEVDGWLGRPLHPAMNRKVFNMNSDHGPIETNSHINRSSATFQNLHYGTILNQTTPFFAFLPTIFSVEAVAPVPFPIYHCPAQF